MKNYIYLFVAVIAMASCQKTEIDGEKFSKRKVEKYLSEGSWQILDFTNPNNFKNFPYSMNFDGKENEVSILGAVTNEGDHSEYELLKTQSDSASAAFYGNYEVDKKDIDIIYFKSGDITIKFRINKLSAKELELIRFDIGSGYSDEVYQMKNTI